MDIFATSPDWASPVIERIGYLTDVIKAYDDTEQRIQLRDTANGAIVFLAACMEARDSAQSQALLWAKQADVIYVPWWPDAQPLQAAVSAGEDVLTVDTTNRDFTEEKNVLIWRDAYTFESQVIDILTEGSITIVATLDDDYPAGAMVVPLKPCRLSDRQSITRANTDIADIQVEFTTEADETPEHTGDVPTQYQGFDVLEELPNNTPEFAVELSRSATLLDSQTGTRVVDDRSGIATTERGFNWFADGRENVIALKQFIHRRKGRAVPFWSPTFRADLPLADDVAAGVTFDIEHIGYTVNVFPDIARRHVAFITPGGEITLRKVSGAVDNEDGTETITVTVALPVFPQSTMVSFATLMRLADDTVEIEWSTVTMAEASFGTVEVTREVPA